MAIRAIAVEDDEAVARLIAQVLTTHGFQVCGTAASGSSGRAAATRRTAPSDSPVWAKRVMAARRLWVKRGDHRCTNQDRTALGHVKGASGGIPSAGLGIRSPFVEHRAPPKAMEMERAAPSLRGPRFWVGGDMLPQARQLMMQLAP